MSRAALSLFVFGVYILGMSILLLVAPNVMLTFFGFPPTEEPWIRIAGMFLLFLAVYDLLAARAELRDFIRWTVPVRASVILFFGTFVLLGLAGPVLVLLSLVDLTSAIWTAVALRKDRLEPRVIR
ncbi:MAG TPA: DUF2768 family protein [Thermoanaerobaculia bacterium]|nr:DUF2768 family protein [Thermoanaerobaculia bacterium]